MKPSRVCEFVSDLLKELDPRVIRLALLGHHYRAGFNWTDDGAAGCEALLEDLVRAARWHRGPDPDATLTAVRVALDDDLDTPTALAAITEHARGEGDHRGSGAGLARAADLLGIDL